MSKDKALLVIDAQMGLLEGEQTAYRKEEVLASINDLLERARANGTPVIYVQHDGEADSPLKPNTPGWEIHPAIAPGDGEPIVHKRACDSFYQTPLKSELDARGVKHLVIAGCMTQYCVDTTSRSATTQGYNVTLAKDAHTTVDGKTLTAAQIVAHHNEILNDFGDEGFVIKVKPSSEIAF